MHLMSQEAQIYNANVFLNLFLVAQTCVPEKLIFPALNLTPLKDQKVLKAHFRK